MAVAIKSKRTDIVKPDFMAGLAFHILRELDLEDSELSVCLVGKDEIRRLNKKFRRNDRLTDVLSFPQNDGAGPAGEFFLLGDVVICLEQAVLQAKELGHTPREELAVLLIHGILHLLGYDDSSSALRERMFKKQDSLLKRLRKKNLI